MLNINRLNILLISLLVLVGCQSVGGSRMSGSAAEIDGDVDYALNELYESTPAARTLAKQAKGILVFPRIVKAGFMVGAQYGRGGALRVRGQTVGYYNSVAASYGMQAGVQSFGYALFFMNAAAMNYLNQRRLGNRRWPKHSRCRCGRRQNINHHDRERQCLCVHLRPEKINGGTGFAGFQNHTHLSGLDDAAESSLGFRRYVNIPWIMTDSASGADELIITGFQH